MTKKNTTPTIILELTPREAAVIYTVAWTANHLEGDYREECKAIAEALEDVSYAHDKHVAIMVNRGGFRMGGSFWFIDEANEDESFHPYSGA